MRSLRVAEIREGVKAHLKIMRVEILIDRGGFSATEDWKKIKNDITESILSLEHPRGSGKFVLRGESGKKRGMGSGVRPIRDMFCEKMVKLGWHPETRIIIAGRLQPGPLDVTRNVGRKIFAVEWETGNISSSHRAVNKMALGMQKDVLIGGVLIVPTRRMYNYLTDRVGNFEELEPYFSFWRSVQLDEGLFAVFAVEHDAVDPNAPRIRKGTNGRALF